MASVDGTGYSEAALSGVPSIAPDSRRLAQAHAAGLRPGSRWLRVAAHGLALVLLAPWLTSGLLGQTRALWRAVFVLGTPSWELALTASARALALLGAGVLGAAVVAELAVAIVTRALGPRASARGLRRLGRVGSWRRRYGALHLIGLLLLGVLAMMAVGTGLVAGAARAVDASPRGLELLWSTWWSRALVTCAGLLAVLGALERRLGAHARWRALHQTYEERRRELQENRRR